MKNVVIKRAMTLVLPDVEKPKKQGDPAVISDALYERHPDWYQLIEDVPDDDEDLEAFTVEELRDRLRDADLKVSGTKDELVERLRNHA